MSEPINYPITLMIGETEDFRLTVANELGAAVDMAGGKVWFTIKNDFGDADDGAILLLNSEDDVLQFDMALAASGIVDFSLTAEQTSQLSGSNEYVYAFKVKLSTGKTKFPVQGSITVLEGGITDTD